MALFHILASCASPNGCFDDEGHLRFLLFAFVICLAVIVLAVLINHKLQG